MSLHGKWADEYTLVDESMEKRRYIKFNTIKKTVKYIYLSGFPTIVQKKGSYNIFEDKIIIIFKTWRTIEEWREMEEEKFEAKISVVEDKFRINDKEYSRRLELSAISNSWYDYMMTNIYHMTFYPLE